ncbi:MAG: hypothetical protein Q7U04_07495 [Bacteriovorax sp.]|nr:hypothetical protein [Bacteriovorax sp.]
MNKISQILELIFRTTKVLMINTIIYSLIQIPFVSEGFAAGGGDASNVILGLANTTIGLYGSFLGQKQQILQQQINSVNNQKLIAQFSPTCRKADGTACFSSPAKFFPECPLPPSMATMPTNVCNNATPDVNKIGSMITYESIAEGWMNYYDQMSNEASNETYATGLRCLNDKEKAMDSQLTEMVNNLTRMQTVLKTDSERFQADNKKILEEMATANDELNGTTKNNIDLKTMDFSKYFSQSCRDVIGEEKLNGGKERGLNGIFQSLSPVNSAAAKFNLNKNVIEADVTREKDKIIATIADKGVQDFLATGYQSQINGSIKSIPTLIAKEAQEMDTAKKRILKELAAVGYEPDAMDKNFSTDINEFIAVANTTFEKKYINDCVTGADKGAAVPIDEILRNVRVNTRDITASDTAAANMYRQKVQETLALDISMTDKLDIIKNLPSPPLVVTYNTVGGSRVTDSPYNIFMKIVDNCKARIGQTDKGSTGVTYAKKIERGKAALVELKNLNDNFASKITQSISDQVLNCNGSAPKSGHEYCNEDTLNPATNDTFCIANASTCANSITACYGEANNQVQLRKTKIKNMANIFNQRVAGQIAASNSLYKGQEANIMSLVKNIQSKFPGTNFLIPKDMSVSMPELSKDAFGVDLAGNGDQKSFLEGPGSMTEKIEKLKQLFTKQQDSVKKVIEDYIGLQRTAMDKQRGRWEKLYDQCKENVKSSSQGLAKMNEAGQKNQNEADGLVKKYCNKYSDLRQNPTPSCEDAKGLVDDMQKIILKNQEGRIVPQASRFASKYDNLCKALKNEGSDTDIDEKCSHGKTKADDEKCAALQQRLQDKKTIQALKGKEASSPKLSDLCSRKDTSDEKFLQAALSYLPKEDRNKIEESKDEFLNALKDPTKDFPSVYTKSFKDAGFFRKLKDLMSKPSEKTICENIYGSLVENSNAKDIKDKASYTKTLSKINGQISSEKTNYDNLDKDYTAASPENKPALKIRLDNKNAEIDKLNAAKTAASDKIDVLDTKIKENADTSTSEIDLKVNGRNILADLEAITDTPDINSENGIKVQLKELTNLGEQMDESCDAQNINSLAKTSNSFMDQMQAHDAQVLGTMGIKQ